MARRRQRTETPSVHYRGPADVRIMRPGDIEGLTADVVWDVSNGWAVPQSDIADDVVEFLRSQPDFEVR